MHLSRFLLTLLCAVAFVTVGFAQTMVPGQIKTARIEKAVSRISAAGVTTPLKNGDLLVETDTVVTGHGASVVLVFANGASVRVSEDSKLNITTFKVDPLAEGKPVGGADLAEEPTTSRTSLNLNYGEMVGKVAKLHIDRGSSFEVKTPVGAAGIRGTIFRIVFHPADNGQAFFTIQTQEGVVVATNATNQQISTVQAGKEVSVTADVTVSATGVVTVSNVTVANQDLSPTAAAVIQSAATTILQAQQGTTFTSNTSGTSGSTSVTPSGTTNTASDLSGNAGK